MPMRKQKLIFDISFENDFAKTEEKTLTVVSFMCVSIRACLSLIISVALAPRLAPEFSFYSYGNT